MTDQPDSTKPPEPTSAEDDFAAQAEAEGQGNISEFFEFLRYNKKWWLTPILLALMLLGVLIVLTNSAWVAPIYTLF